MITKLQIINEAIKAVGLAPVASMDSKLPSFLKALSTFEHINGEVQSKGWWFNDHIKTLNPGSDGQIVVPQYATSIQVEDRPEIVMRGNRLYNIIDSVHTFNGPVTGRIIETLPIEVVPPSMRYYISIRTKLAHYVDEDGGDPKLSVYMQAHEKAEAIVKAEDLKFRQLTSKDGKTYIGSKWPHSRSTRVNKVRG